MAPVNQPSEDGTAPESVKPPADAYIRWGLLVVAIALVIAAGGHAVWPERVDTTTGLFLGLAAGVLIIREISKLETPWLKLERVRQELKQEVQKVDDRVDVVETQGGLPGRPAGLAVSKRDMVAEVGGRRTAKANDGWNADPNKGKFGGSPEANNRILEAEITPVTNERSAACNVILRVRSTDPVKHPLAGKVTVHLHPTFARPVYQVNVVRGVAEDEITSWGAFTVGAEADEGKTRLELDLMDVEGGTKKFYDS
jgi:hypothetical protein